jgi:hypothetical protein
MWLTTPVPSRLGFGQKGPLQIFSFPEASHLLLDRGTRKTMRFPFDKEIAIVILLSWILWPDDYRRQQKAARITAATFFGRRRKPDGTFEGMNEVRAAVFRRRLKPGTEYRNFYDNCFVPLGGLASSLDTSLPHEWDSQADARRSELNSSLDMLQFFLIRRLTYPEHATSRRLAEKFVERNGFSRELNFYGGRVGEKRGKDRDKETWIKKNTISTRWDHAPSTLGLAFVLRYCWPDLWLLKLSDIEFPNKLVDLAGNNAQVLDTYQYYNWLLDLTDDAASSWQISDLYKIVDLIKIEAKLVDTTKPLELSGFDEDQIYLIQRLLQGKKGNPKQMQSPN